MINSGLGRIIRVILHGVSKNCGYMVGWLAVKHERCIDKGGSEWPWRLEGEQIWTQVYISRTYCAIYVTRVVQLVIVLMFNVLSTYITPGQLV